MSSFDGAAFDERGQQNGAFLPIHGTKVTVTVIKIPGGAQSFVQVGHTIAAPFDLPIQSTASELSALRGKKGVTGSLIYAGGTVAATLVEVADALEVKTPNDTYQATLKFLV